jgi:2-phosphosulfolactate phosphatase
LIYCDQGVWLMPRALRVALLPSLRDESAADRSSTVVVIDALRFTTTACQALAAGAHSIRVAATIAEARQQAEQTAICGLLCGERHCLPIEGFDFGNSPLEYSAERVMGRNLVFTTTNGTLAVAAAGHTASVMLAAFVNRAAVVHRLRERSARAVTLICAGTDGKVAAEDVLTAGAIARHLLDTGNSSQPPFQCDNDAALLAIACWDELAGKMRSAADLIPAIRDRIGQGLGGRQLIESGFAKDVQFASELDSIDLVPETTESEPGVFSSQHR